MAATHPYEQLFNEFNALGPRVQLLRGIVQNTGPIPPEYLETWIVNCKAAEKELADLRRRVTDEVSKTWVK